MLAYRMLPPYKMRMQCGTHLDVLLKSVLSMQLHLPVKLLISPKKVLSGLTQFPFSKIILVLII